MGLLTFTFEGAPKPYARLHQKLFVSAMNWVEKKFFAEESQAYEDVNRAMLTEAKKHLTFDGELSFFAVHPAAHGKGVGSLLLQHAEQNHGGSTIYLYTDTGCTYQFYEKRGFERAGEQVAPALSKGDEPLTCLLYTKTLKGVRSNGRIPPAQEQKGVRPSF